MRKLLVSIAAALLAACGSSSSGSSGGGGGALTGHVGGRTFTPTQAKAVVAGSGATGCGLVLNPLDPSSVTTVGVKAVAIEVAAFDPASVNSSACDDLSSVACRYHANSQTVTILVAKVNLMGAAEPALGPDPYTVSSTLAPPSVFTTGYVAYAQALAVDPSYAATSEKSLDGGNVTLTQVSSAGPVAGHVNLTFEEGSAVSGTFSANACGGATLQVCDLANTLASAILLGSSGGLCTLPADHVP